MIMLGLMMLTLAVLIRLPLLRNNAAASTDPNLLPAIDQANKDAEARLGNDAEAREQLRRHLGAAP